MKGALNKYALMTFPLLFASPFQVLWLLILFLILGLIASELLVLFSTFKQGYDVHRRVIIALKRAVKLRVVTCSIRRVYS